MSEIIERAKSPTPSFFKKVRNTAVIISAIAGLILSLPFSWPAWTTTVLTFIVAICSSIAGTSQLTTKERSNFNIKQ